MAENIQKNPVTFFKKYQCSECKFETKISTNHYSSCYSHGRLLTCPNCPPFKKYPEFGGSTVWLCMEA